MNRHAQGLQLPGFRPGGRKDVYIGGARQAAGHPPGGIVVAGNDENGNPGFAQAPHLSHEVEAGVVIPPVAIEQITGD